MRKLIDQPVNYGPYVLQTDGTLRWTDGTVAPLPRRLALPLMVLMEARGGTVTKDALISRCWPQAEISEQNLARAIADLRKLFKREGQNPVKTVYGVGYRFDIPVHVDSVAEDSAYTARDPKADVFHREALHRMHVRRAGSLDVAERLLKEAAEMRGQPADWLAIALVDVHRIQLGYTTAPAAWPRLRSAAERALKGTPADALSLLALGLCWAEWDFSAAGELLERARRIAPNSYVVNRCAGLKEQMVGNDDLAKHYFRRAVEANPLALPVSASLVITLAMEGKSNDAFAEIQHMVNIDSESPLTLGFRALAETRLGDPALAVAPAKQSFDALPESALFATILAYALSAAGQREAAREMLERPSIDGEAFGNSNTFACWAWLCMDNPGEALRTLRHVFERRCPFLPVILRDPMLAPVASDPDYQAIFDAVFKVKHPSVHTG